MPGLDRFHDFQRNPEEVVDVPLLAIRRGSLPDVENGALRCGQDHRHNLVGAELPTEGRPGGVDSLIQEVLFDGDQQMVGQHAEKDVGLGTVLQLVENGTLHQRGLHIPERLFHTRQQKVGAPDLIGA